jgi:hypothetical protein
MTAGHVALVGHAHIGHGVAADKAIAANEAEHAGQHLIAARAVVRVQQDDFVGFAPLIWLAWRRRSMCFVCSRLPSSRTRVWRHHEGLKPFLRSSVSTAAVGM